MVSVEKQNGNFIFEVKGMHKLWALKSELTIPVSHVLNAHKDAEGLQGWWKGWRDRGTSIPGVITAGTFYKDGDKMFWDISNINNAITIELQDEDFRKLIIEVEDPLATLALLTEQA